MEESKQTCERSDVIVQNYDVPRENLSFNQSQSTHGNAYPQPVLAQPVSSTVNNQVYVQQPNHLVVHKSPVPDTLILSIISMVFCIILGLVALILSLQSRKSRDIGQVEEARKKARYAKCFAFAAIIVSVILIVIAVITRAIVTVLTSVN
ncbi:DgyrCDS14621 [Dimorphilus gyrociliatus]|uniref:DgyrCDS14621 n=1 Tax=Dimorphilus gyrociliatus TaxID=2664684 RepID=A0A7I8WEA0_9ANNE|nr:DgyrCDS14621 [Dimorphilus gyrociliatus]